MSRATVIQDIEALLSKLSLPVSAAEAEDGWTTQSKAAARDYFEKLQTALNQGSEMPDLGIARGLDHWGVVGGELLKEAARITNYVREARAL